VINHKKANVYVKTERKKSLNTQVHKAIDIYI